MNEVKSIDIKKIREDQTFQLRADGIADAVVDDYSTALQDGASFPPVILFFIEKELFLIDGFHRLAAYKQCGKTHIPAIVKTGSRDDALVYSVGANATHGLRRTNKDKQNSVIALLDLEEWFHKSDRAIAKQAGVSYTMVSKLRKEFIEKKDVSKNSSRKKKKIVAQKLKNKNTTATKLKNEINEKKEIVLSPAAQKEILRLQTELRRLKKRLDLIKRGKIKL